MEKISQVTPEVIGEGIKETRNTLENSKGMDKLSHMFSIQKSFADLCFLNNNIRDKEGKILTCDTVAEDAAALRLKYSDLMVPWLWEMVRALEDETQELRDLLPWKHWSKAQVGQMEHPECSPEERLNHLRLELIDQIHFIMEALLFTGLDAEGVYKMYLAKNEVNIQRQEKAYNDANKTQADNDGIAKTFGK